MIRYFIPVLILTAFISSCEEVIEVDLDANEPEFVVEAIIYKDSVCKVQLTGTAGYFSMEEPSYIENASVIISDGTASEELSYEGNGYYRGSTITGTEEKTYEIEINHEGKVYYATSYMPKEPHIESVSYNVSNAQSTLNPFGETVVDINCIIEDDITKDNYYLLRYSDSNGKLIERYYLLTENVSNSGHIDYENGKIIFSESIFYEGSFITMRLFAVDKAVYDYFLQLTDILFWKRRIMPPTPYNPESNISNGVLGYFVAWSYDSEVLVLE
jgi:hypothetical protein